MDYYKAYLKRVEEHENDIIEEKSQSKPLKRRNVWIGFFIFGFILLVNVIIMTLYLYDSNYEYKILNNVYIDAVLPNQVIDQTLDLGIVRIEEAVIDELVVGDKIVMYGDFQLDVYWVETVVAIDLVTSQVQTTYDQITINTLREDEIVGVYIEDANFFGTIYYSASFLEGFIFLTISHAIILFGYWFVLLYKKNE